MSRTESMVKKEFENALRSQNARKLEEAEAGYRAVLAFQPDHADAQHSLAPRWSRACIGIAAA